MHCTDKNFEDQHYDDVPIGAVVQGNGWTATCLSDEMKEIPESLVRDGTDGGMGYSECEYKASRAWSVTTDEGRSFTAVQTLTLWRQSQTHYGEIVGDDDEWGIVSSSLSIDGVTVDEGASDNENGPRVLLSNALESHLAPAPAPAL